MGRGRRGGLPSGISVPTYTFQGQIRFQNIPKNLDARGGGGVGVHS